MQIWLFLQCSSATIQRLFTNNLLIMFKGHPKGLYVAFFANMGERFGFYTMMAILVLFLQAKFNLTTENAGYIYAIFYFSINCPSPGYEFSLSSRAFKNWSSFLYPLKYPNISQIGSAWLTIRIFLFLYFFSCWYFLQRITIISLYLFMQ